MLLLSLQSSQGLLLLAAGVSGSGLLLWLWQKSRQKPVDPHSAKQKSARPNRTGKKQPDLTFFKPTAGRMNVNIAIPRSGYNVAELRPFATRLAVPNTPAGSVAASSVVAAPGVAASASSVSPATSSVPVPVAPAPTPADEPLDDPAFAPAPDAGKLPVFGQQVVAIAVDLTDSGAPGTSTTGFQLRVDRQLLSRLLSDDGLCGQFEHYRSQTLTLQRSTGRAYADLFRELIAAEPADTQAVLLNLLTDDEVADYQAAG